MTFLSVFSLVNLLSSALADYPCLCSYAADTKLYSQQSTSSKVIGHMYEFDCKPEYTDASLTAGWKAVMIDHHVGYIKKVNDVSSTTCQGHIPSMDKVTTGPPTTPTTPTSTTTSASPPSTINLRSRSTALRKLSTSSLSTSSSSKTTSPPSIVTSTPVSTSTRKTTTRRVTETIRTTKTSKNTQSPTTTHKNTIDPLTTESANEMTTGPPTTPASTSSTTYQRSTVLGQSSTPSSSSSSSSKTTFIPSMVTSVTSTPAPMTSTRKSTTQRITTTTRTTKRTNNTQPQTTTHNNTVDPLTNASAKTTYKCPDNVIQAAVHNHGATRVNGSTCYELVPDQYHWYDAEANCKHKGGHLVHVQNMAEENNVMRFLYDHGFKHTIWIGLTDLNSENYFHWTSGDPVTFTKWMPGHVSNFANHHYEDCVVLVPYIKAGFSGSHGLWDDIPCDDARPWICQYDAQPVHSLSGHIFRPGFFNHGHTTKSSHIVFTTKTPIIGGLAQVLDIVGKK